MSQHSSKNALRARARQALPTAWYWAPLLALALWTALTASGVQPAARAVAATDQDVVVTGTVANEVHLNAVCPAASLTIPELVPGDPALGTSTDCDISFGTTNVASGAELQVSDAGGAGPAMRCVSAGCGASTLADFEGVNLTNGFGMRLRATTAAVTGGWTVNAAAAASGSGQHYDVQDVGDPACQTSSTLDGTCSFRFAAAAPGTQAPGDYQAQVLVEAFPR